MIPYYALGVYQSGSQSTLNSEDSLNGMFTSYATNNMILEGVMIYAYQEKPAHEFTVNTVTFPTIQTSMTAIQAKNQRVIWGASSAISNDKDYAGYGSATTN